MPSERKSVHVIASSGGWAVKKARASRATRHFAKREDAVSWARKISREEAGELIVHGRDGMIRSVDTFGRDPHPPKSRK